MLKDFIYSNMCSDYNTPLFQIGTYIFFGAIFGPLSWGWIYTVAYYIIFEIIFMWATDRCGPYYIIEYRFFAISLGLISWYISRRIYLQ